MAKILFQLNKIYTQLVVVILSATNKWRNVEGIFLPLLYKTGFDTNRWILNGQYESGEINIIKKRIHKDDVVFEIGTGLGFISSFCAKIVGSENVFTYEANAQNSSLIKNVFTKNNVHPFFTNAMLSVSDGSYSFPVNANNLLGSSAFIDTDTFVTIPQLALNNEIKKIKPTFLIMDIEGGEYDIFSIIAFYTIQKIQFELHPKILGKKKCNKIFELLKANGFKIDNEVSNEVNYFFYK